MEKNKTKIITVASLLALVILIIGATYAYFVAQTGEGSQTDIRINANTVDTLTFETGDPITLTLDQENFAEGKGNQTGSTFAKAMLTANNKTNTATEHYYMYLNITGNTFTYTQDEDTPEILLTITDTNNNEITSITGLTYKTVTDGNGTTLKGFDITTQNDLITIFDNREITTTSSITEEWNVTLTYVNYNVDQSANAGKNFGASIIVQKEKLPSILSDVCNNGDNLANCITTLSSKSIPNATKIYYHDSSLANGAGDNSYRYAGEDAHSDFYSCKYDGNDVVNIYDAINKTLKENCSNVYKVMTSDKIFYADQSYSKMLTNKITIGWDNINNKCLTSNGIAVYDFNNKPITEETKCNGNAYYNTSSGLYQSGIEEMGAGEENLVTLAESGVNNFVCFGTNESPCPTDNLYRIIGVIDNKVKLIKYDYASSALLGTDGDYNADATTEKMPPLYYKGLKEITEIGTYSWNFKADTTKKYGSNTWSTSLLNKINLNTNFINNIEDAWINKIATTTWKVGGTTWQNVRIAIPSIVSQKEIVSPDASGSTDNVTEYEAKIGLMYVSDYGFAASPESWTEIMFNYIKTKSNNWIYMGLNEWTITRQSANSVGVYPVIRTGCVNNFLSYEAFAIRPVFNLESSVTYVSGSGTQSDPILIN